MGNVYEQGVLNYEQDLGEIHTGTYQFGRSYRIRLIEPWGIKINMQVGKYGTTTVNKANTYKNPPAATQAGFYILCKKTEPA